MKTNLLNRLPLRASSFAGLVLGSLAVVCGTYSPTYGVVVLRDGFGDGDRNNDGVAFDATDVIEAYQPHFDDASMTVDGSPPLFPANTVVLPPTTPDSGAGAGIRWSSTGGITNNGTGDPAAAPRIINDSAGYQPETVGSGAGGFFNAISGQTETIPALDSGLALGVEGKGRTRGISAFFETDGDYSNGKQGTIALGPKVNDEVKVSFDFRVWMSAPNFNEEDTTNHVPNRAEIRFGLYEDADDQLGMTNNIAGPLFTPAVWGQDDGAFRGDLVGPDATGDPGWFARLPIYDPDAFVNPLFGPFPDGRTARIVQETNELPANLARHLQGSSFANGGDTVTIAQPDEDPPLSGNFDFMTMENTKRYRIEFSLKRIDETGGSTNPADDGDNIQATVTVTDIDNPSITKSLTGFNALDPEMMDETAGFYSEAWDYFAISTGGSSDSDGLDFVLDNFEVAVIGSNEPADEFDGADLIAIQRTNPSLIAQWQSGFGNSASSPAFSAVPEPTTLISLCLGSLLAVGARRRRVQS